MNNKVNTYRPGFYSAINTAVLTAITFRRKPFPMIIPATFHFFIND